MLFWVKGYFSVENSKSSWFILCIHAWSILSLFDVLKDVYLTVIKCHFILLLQCDDISENLGPKMFSKIVQGTFSQGNSKFSESAGLQCCAIALYAGAFSCLKQMSRWTSETLDRIVEGGDDLFHLIGKNRYLGVEDLPQEVLILNAKVSVAFRYNVHGIFCRERIYQNTFKDMILNETIDNSGVLVWLSEICIYIGFQQFVTGVKYALFDSHSRGPTEKIAEEGTSILLLFDNIDSLTNYIYDTYLDDVNREQIAYQVQILRFCCISTKRKVRWILYKHAKVMERNKEINKKVIMTKTSDERALR